MLYDYKCTSCGLIFDEFCSLAEQYEHKICPRCGNIAEFNFTPCILMAQPLSLWSKWPQTTTAFGGERTFDSYTEYKRFLADNHLVINDNNGTDSSVRDPRIAKKLHDDRFLEETKHISIIGEPQFINPFEHIKV